MKPRNLKKALEMGYVKKGNYISSTAHIPDRVRIDLQHRYEAKFASFWVTRKYAERMGFNNAY